MGPLTTLPQTGPVPHVRHKCEQGCIIAWRMAGVRQRQGDISDQDSD